MVCNRIFAFRSLCLAGLGFAAAVQAGATLYGFTFLGTDGQFSASGQLDVNALNQVIDGNMTVTAAPDSAAAPHNQLFAGNYTLAAVDQYNAFYYDNVLFPSGTPQLDINGLLFQSSVGGPEVNIYGNGAGQPYAFLPYAPATSWYPNTNGDFGSFKATAVPEPFTMALCAAGLGLAFARRRRR